MRRPRYVLAGLIAGLIAGLALAGCSSVSVEQLPLPGGANLGSHPYKVRVQFADALNLVPQAAVRVNDVAVGRVEKVSLPRGQWFAEVTVLVNGDVRLPGNATANLEQSSLLGEKYIALAAPAVASGGRLGNGSVIPLARTGRNADTEEVLGALSMLLSGGGLPQIRTITQEFNNALNGREGKIRAALENLSTFTTTLDKNKSAIVDALDGLDRLSATVAARRGQVDGVLTGLSPGLKVINDQRSQLVGLLRKLTDLGDVATRVVNSSRDATAADLRDLAVVLRRLADAGDDLPKSLQILFTFPFTDEVLNGVKGDYLNGYLSVVANPGSNCVIPSNEVFGSGTGSSTSSGTSGTSDSGGSTLLGPQPVPCPTSGGTAPRTPTLKVQPAPASSPAPSSSPSSSATAPRSPSPMPPLPLPTLGSGG